MRHGTMLASRICSAAPGCVEIDQQLGEMQSRMHGALPCGGGIRLIAAVAIGAAAGLSARAAGGGGARGAGGGQAKGGRQHPRQRPVHRAASRTGAPARARHHCRSGAGRHKDTALDRLWCRARSAPPEHAVCSTGPVATINRIRAKLLDIAMKGLVWIDTNALCSCGEFLVKQSTT